MFLKKKNYPNEKKHICNSTHPKLLNTYQQVCFLLSLGHVGILSIKHVVPHHLFPHSAGPLSHLQHPFVQVGADGGSPEPSFPQQLVLDLRPLLRHVLQRVLLALNTRAFVNVWKRILKIKPTNGFGGLPFLICTGERSSMKRSLVLFFFFNKLLWMTVSLSYFLRFISHSSATSLNQMSSRTFGRHHRVEQFHSGRHRRATFYYWMIAQNFLCVILKLAFNHNVSPHFS